MNKTAIPLVITLLLLLTSFISLNHVQAQLEAEPRQPTATAVDDEWLYASVWYTNNNDISYSMLNKMSKSGTVVANIQIDDTPRAFAIANGEVFAVCQNSIYVVNIDAWTVTQQWSYTDFNVNYCSFFDVQAVGNYVYVLGSTEDPDTYDNYLTLWRIDASNMQNLIIAEVVVTTVASNPAMFTVMNNVAYICLDEDMDSIMVSIPLTSFPPDQEDIVVFDTTNLDPDATVYPQSIVNDGTYLYVADSSSGYIYKLDATFTMIDRSDTSSYSSPTNYGWFYLRSMSYYNGYLYLADSTPAVGEVLRLDTSDMATISTVVLSDVTFTDEVDHYSSFLCLDGTSIFVALDFTPMIIKLSISPFDFDGNFTSVGTGVTPPASPTPSPSGNQGSGSGSGFGHPWSTATPLPTLAHTSPSPTAQTEVFNLPFFVVGACLASIVAVSFVVWKRR